MATSSTSTIVQQSALLQLPNEVIHNIAKALPAYNNNLHHLALTCRRLSVFATETLVCNGTVSECGIPEYFKTLSRSPRWANHVERVHIRPGWRGGRFLNSDTKRACLQYVQTLSPTFATEVFRFAVRIHMQSIAFWTIALLAALPSARHVKLNSDICLLNIDYTPFFKLRRRIQYPEPRSNLTNYLHDIIQGRLESLELPDGYPISGWGLLFPLRLGPFRRLRDLSLHGGSFRGADLPRITSMIPPQLERLKIYCDEETCPWFFLVTVYKYNKDGKLFPNLRQIELFFNVSCTYLAHFLDGDKDPSGRTIACLDQRTTKNSPENGEDVTSTESQAIEPFCTTYFNEDRLTWFAPLKQRTYTHGCVSEIKTRSKERLNNFVGDWRRTFLSEVFDD